MKPTLATLAAEALSRLSRRTLWISGLLCLLVGLIAAYFWVRPLEAEFVRFRNETRDALVQRNRALVQTSVEQGAANLMRLLGAAEQAVERLGQELEHPSFKSNAEATPPLEREFYPGGKLVPSLARRDGYASAVTFEFPQIKATDTSDVKAMKRVWAPFKESAQKLHSYTPELKWLYAGTSQGGFLVYPASPEIPAGFDPRQRPWYQQAMESDQAVWVSPYFTAGGNDLVLTVARRLSEHSSLAPGVVAVDVVMADVVRELLATPYCEACTFWVVDNKGQVLGKGGDFPSGPTWTEGPAVRTLEAELGPRVPGLDAKRFVQSLRVSKKDSVPVRQSRFPKAVEHSDISTSMLLFSAPIEALGWHLVGIVPRRSVGADGDRVLDAISALVLKLRWGVVLLLILSVLLVLSVTAALFWIARKTVRESFEPVMSQFEDLSQAMEQMELSSPLRRLRGPESLSAEHEALTQGLQKMRDRLVEEAAKREALLVEAKVGEQAREVSHNMRTPIEALELALPRLSVEAKDTTRVIRTAIEEIRGLANRLKHRTPQAAVATAKATVSTGPLPVQLGGLLQAIAAQRLDWARATFPGRAMELTCDIEDAARSAYVAVEASELRLLVTNLLNNAIEAIEATSGKVELRTYLDNGKLVIEIKDNGKGIPRHLISRLGNAGVTFEKKGGSGLGLSHARRHLAQWGGTLVLDSVPGEGTRVVIALPVAPTPGWVAESINLTGITEVVALDDDPSMLEAWKLSLKDAPGARPGLRVEGFVSARELRVWHSREAKGPGGRLYLVDYHLGGDSKSGLDVIEELGIENQSILVTSAYDDPEVVGRARWLGVRVAGKALPLPTVIGDFAYPKLAADLYHRVLALRRTSGLTTIPFAPTRNNGFLASPYVQAPLTLRNAPSVFPTDRPPPVPRNKSRAPCQDSSS